GRIDLGDDDHALVRGGHVHVDARGKDLVVLRVGRGADLVVDGPTHPLQLAGDDVVADVASHVDRVASAAADDARGHAERRADDVEVVVALQAVHLDRLDVGEADVDAGAEDALFGDDEVVVELGAPDHN